METLNESNSISISNVTNTTNQSDQSISINLIVKKLGHDLGEIRMRSLDSLISKLDNHVLTEHDLAQHKQLFVKLFELFNYNDFDQHERVLNLLLIFSKNKSAVKNIQDICGLQFLNSLKNDIKEQSLKIKIEQIVDQLMETSSQPDQSGTNYSKNTLSQSNSELGILYSSTSSNQNTFNSNDLDQLKQLQSQMVYNDSSSGGHVSSVRAAINAVFASNEYVSTSDLMSNQMSCENSFRSSSTNTMTDNYSYKRQNFEMPQSNLAILNQDRNTINLTSSSYYSMRSKLNQPSFSINSNDFSYNTKNFLNNDFQHKENNNNTFYWLPLTLADKNFLSTTENTLRTNDPKNIRSYCTFLQTIVFNDFPAEIFLQRSSILKILIDLIIKSTVHNQESYETNKSNASIDSSKSDQINEENSVLKSLILCINYYCKILKKRISYIKDPSTFCYKDFHSNGQDYFSKSINIKKINKINPIDSSRSTKSNKDNLLNTSLYSIDNQSVANSAISSIKSSTIDSKNSTLTSTKSNMKTNKNSDNPKLKSSISQPNFSNIKKNKRNSANSPRYSYDDSAQNGLKEFNEIEDFPLIDETINQDFQNSIETFLSETNEQNYETDLNEMNNIKKSEEWPIYSFCFRLIDTFIDNISLILIKNNKNFSNNNASISLSTNLLPTIFESINNLIDILYETKTEWCNINLNENLMNLFQKLNSNIKYLINKSNELSSDKNLNISNRLVYLYLVVTFYKIVNLMCSTDETSILMPSELSETLFLILNDICLVDSFKSISLVFSTILTNLDKSLFNIYLLSNEICDSMRCACEFLMKYNQINLKDELIEMAKKSLNYMDYHVCIEISSKIVEFSSKIMSSDKEQEKTKVDIEYLITSCMISKCDEIRVETYSSIYRIVSESLNVQIATEINSKRYKGINFLLLNKVFYQFITFGLFDKSLQVKKLCEKILIHLLQCELLVPESFRLRLTQLVIVYMPFIQCFASQVEVLGQCILKMSDDLLTPTVNNANSKLTEDALKLFLTPAIERLRCSMRYLYSKDKNLRKKGYQQTIGFLTRYHRLNQLNNSELNDENGLVEEEIDSNSKSCSFNLNDFYLRFLPDKFCEITGKLKRKNRTFLTNNYENSSNQYTISVFQTDNLLRIFNIFTSETVDLDVKQNAGEQLAIMISTGDQRLHKAFINLDGVNYCIRLLKNTILKNNLNKSRQHLFLSNVEKEYLNKIHSSCISCLCNIFYWNKEIRQLYLFDIEIYRLIIKSLIISYNMQIKAQNEFETSNQSNVDINIFTNCQEDLSIILFILLYHQVSCLDYYHTDVDKQVQIAHKFDLSFNLKEHLMIPFSVGLVCSNSINQTNQALSQHQFEIKQLEKQQFKTYELNYKLNSLLKIKLDNFNQEKSLNLNEAKNDNLEMRLHQILERKFRLYWNFKWHGGSLLKLCNDLINNEQFVQKANNSNFSDALCLNDIDKFLVKYSSPIYLFKQLYNDLNTCTTHQNALVTLDLIEMLISIIDEDKFQLDIDNEVLNLNSDEKNKLINDEYDAEFYTKHSLKYYFNKYKCDWHLALNRFTSILPSTKSRMDQLLYSSSFRIISKMLDLQTKSYDNTNIDLNKFSGNSNESDSRKQLVLISQMDTNDDLNSLLVIDKWLFTMIYNPSSSLLVVIKNLLIEFETDETRINSYLIPLCEFIKVYFNRMSLSSSRSSGSGLTSENNFLDQIKLPPIELLKICIEQMQAYEIEKFRNLNKLVILINLIGYLLRVTCNSDIFSSSENIFNVNSTFNNNNKLFIQLIKTLVLIISIFNAGKGGLSLSFMGNFITKSAHICLLQLVKNAVLSSDNQQKTEIVKAVLCLKDQKNKLNGSSWLIPLMLHREPQIRSISFCLMSLLVNVPYTKTKLLVNPTSIWSIALNVLLNRYESSIARTQACAFLINLTQTINPNNEDIDESNISITSLQLLLHEVNFYQQIAFILTTFYPFESYSFSDLVQQDENNSKSKISNNKNEANSTSEISICSPILVSSICQLLYNLNILLNKEAILMVNNNGILNLLINYVKPVYLLTSNSQFKNKKELKLNENLIYMLTMICKYLNLCCQMDQNCILMLLKSHSQNQNRNNIVYDLIECLSINAVNKDKLRPFFSASFELLSTFLNFYEDKSITEICLIIISKCWQLVTNYILYDLLKTDQDLVDSCNLFENALKFYSIYLAKLTQLVNLNSSNNLQVMFDSILYLFDSIDTEPNEDTEEKESEPLGALLARKLIKQFDKYFLVDTDPNLKLIISSLLKGLFVLSNSAKQAAVELGLIETLIEHLKYTHSKLNLKSISLSKTPLKENTLIFDLQQTLLILKYLMCNNIEIKETVTKRGLHSIIHSFWCWSLQDQNLLKTSLSTLCTLTANNKLAINSMVQSNISAQTSNAMNEPRLSSGSSSNLTNGLSLLNSVIKSLQKSLINQSKSSFIIQKYSFSLLTNCAQSNECKNIIWKSNLLQDFTTIDFQSLKLNSAKFNFKLEKLWINFLVSLSFSQDGQQFFMKVESLLPTIIKFLDPIFFSQQSQQSSQFQQNQIFMIQYLSLLILRNLAFNQSNKSKLISNSDYVTTIIHSLRNKNEKFQMLSLSALDALLYEYQKAKVILKNANALKYLVELYEINTTSKPKGDPRILLILNNLIKILNE